MAISIWSELLEGLVDIPRTAQERRAEISARISPIIRAGLNQSQAKRLFREAGIGIRDSDFSAIYKSFSGQIERTDFLASFDFSDEITSNDLGRGNIDYDADYNIIVGFTSYNPETGQTAYQETSFDTNELGSIINLRNQAQRAIEFGDSPPIFAQVQEVTILRGYTNPFRGF